MLVKNQAVQEVQNILIVDKRHSNECRIIKSELESRIRLYLCDHSTFTKKKSIDSKSPFFKHGGKNLYQSLFSVTVHNTGLYKKTKKSALD